MAKDKSEMNMQNGQVITDEDSILYVVRTISRLLNISPRLASLWGI